MLVPGWACGMAAKPGSGKMAFEQILERDRKLFTDV